MATRGIRFPRMSKPRLATAAGSNCRLGGGYCAPLCRRDLQGLSAGTSRLASTTGVAVPTGSYSKGSGLSFAAGSSRSAATRRSAVSGRGPAVRRLATSRLAARQVISGMA